MSDSYIGLDSQRPVTLVVSDPSKVSRIEEVDDISEPEEGISFAPLSITIQILIPKTRLTRRPNERYARRCTGQEEAVQEQRQQ